MTRQEQLTEAFEWLGALARGFKQAPTPEKARLMKKQSNRIKYLQACIRKESK